MKLLKEGMELPVHGLYITCQMKFGRWIVDCITDRENKFLLSPVYPCSRLLSKQQECQSFSNIEELLASEEVGWVYLLDSVSELDQIISNIEKIGAPEYS